MGISTIGAAAGGGEVLPINALEKVYETYSADGYFEYNPAGGVPAGKYIIEVEGSNVDYVEAVGRGQASRGKGVCYLNVEAGGAITATASTFGDGSVAASMQRLNSPYYTFESYWRNPTYSFAPYNTVYINGENWIATSGPDYEQVRLYTSSNGLTWRRERDYSPYTGARDVMINNNLANDPQSMGDMVAVNGYLYMTTPPVNSGNGYTYRTADPRGRAGTWTTIFTETGWNLGKAPTNSSRVILYQWGAIKYSDNDGVSWTTASVPANNPFFSPVIAGNDIYCIDSVRYYSSGSSYIVKSTNNGQSWSRVTPTTGDFGSTYFPVSMANQPGTSNWVIIARDNNNYTYTGYSTDDFANISWSTFTTGTSEPLYNKVLWSEVLGGVWAFAASANDSGVIYTSTDGSTWSALTNPGGAAPGVFIEMEGKLVYQARNASYLWWTADGVTFNQNTSDFSNLHGVTYSGGKYRVTNNTSTILEGTSLDSLNKVNVGVALGSLVSFGDLILAKNNNNYYTSLNGGVSWTAGETNGCAGAPCFTDGKFLRIDTSGNLYSSTDLVTWTQRTTFSTYAPSRIKKLGDLYIAYGYYTTNGGYRLSPDLETWTDYSVSSASTTIWGAVYDATSGWSTFHNGNGSAYSSPMWWVSHPYSSGTYGTQPELSFQNIDNIWTSNTTIRIDGVEAAGLAWIWTGYMILDTSANTISTLKPRMIPTTSYRMVSHYTDAINNQPAVGFGKVTSVEPGSNYLYQFSYGKPASIAIYRMKE